MGIDNNAGNNGYLDMYLEATAEAWVGVGFSTTESMVSLFMWMDAWICMCIYIKCVCVGVICRCHV